MSSGSPIDAQEALLAAIRGGIIPSNEPDKPLFGDMGMAWGDWGTLSKEAQSWVAGHDYETILHKQYVINTYYEEQDPDDPTPPPPDLDKQMERAIEEGYDFIVY